MPIKIFSANQILTESSFEEVDKHPLYDSERSRRLIEIKAYPKQFYSTWDPQGIVRFMIRLGLVILILNRVKSPGGELYQI